MATVSTPTGSVSADLKWPLIFLSGFVVFWFAKDYIRDLINPSGAYKDPSGNTRVDPCVGLQGAPKSLCEAGRWMTGGFLDPTTVKVIPTLEQVRSDNSSLGTGFIPLVPNASGTISLLPWSGNTTDVYKALSGQATGTYVEVWAQGQSFLALTKKSAAPREAGVSKTDYCTNISEGNDMQYTLCMQAGNV